MTSPDERKEQVTQIIKMMDEGASERSACEKVGISRNTFRSAALKMNASDQYAKACVAIAQDQVNKIEEAINDMRSGVIDAAMARVEIDARKWTASKLFGRQYGEKVTNEHTGADGGPLQVQQIDMVIIEPNAKAKG